MAARRGHFPWAGWHANAFGFGVQSATSPFPAQSLSTRWAFTPTPRCRAASRRIDALRAGAEHGVDVGFTWPWGLVLVFALGWFAWLRWGARAPNGSGNDQLFGDQGSDLYVFFHGDGTDLITETDDAASTDIAQLRDIASTDADTSTRVACLQSVQTIFGVSKNTVFTNV